MNALELCQKKIAHYRKKADHNKREALNSFFLVIGATLLAPLFVTLGCGLWLGKVVPSVLSLIAAAATAWVQLRKPQRLWALYRSAERELEIHEIKYEHRLDEYGKSRDPDRLLAKNVVRVYMAIHRNWTQLVPGPGTLRESLNIPTGKPPEGNSARATGGAVVSPDQPAGAQGDT